MPLRRFLIALLVAAGASAAPRNVVLEVSFEGKPLGRLQVEYFDGAQMLRPVTNGRGIVTFALSDAFSEWHLGSGSDDYVLRNVRGEGDRWRADAVHSAAYRMRQHPRPCDAWRKVMDIPRGSLSIESADEYEQWYASLPPQNVRNCDVLTAMAKRIGSKAPWYFYEFKAQPSGCVGGKYGAELDWTAWYRGLLETETHASPGKCVADWERWWAAQGYPPVPAQQRSDE